MPFAGFLFAFLHCSGEARVSLPISAGVPVQEVNRLLNQLHYGDLCDANCLAKLMRGMKGFRPGMR